jgi:hypothetical protein
VEMDGGTGHSGPEALIAIDWSSRGVIRPDLQLFLALFGHIAHAISIRSCSSKLVMMIEEPQRSLFLH